MTAPAVDTIFGFEDQLRRDGHCRIRIFPLQGKTLVIATDINRGPSVTNAAEDIATAVVKQYDIDPERLIWVEHYEHQRLGEPEEYDFVTFEWDGERFQHPDWSYGTRARVEELLGHSLEGGQ